MICISLANITFQECIRIIPKAEFAEIRMDQLDFSDEQFKTVFSLKNKAVATCRPDNHLDEKRRMQLMKLAVESGAGYLDIEYESNEAFRNELIAFAKEHQSKVIISYHHFELTPSTSELEAIIEQSRKWGADFVKIAVMAQSPADCSRVMALYERHTHLIAFCMGKIGTVTRVAAPLLGAEFTFAAPDQKHATAPGQLTIGQLMDIYEII